jgi:hypothetical protein
MTTVKATYFEQVPLDVLEKIIAKDPGRPSKVENARVAAKRKKKVPAESSLDKNS